MDKQELKCFQKKIDFSFRNENLLMLAFTHSSFANEHKLGRLEYNERLEFLGDAALEFIISEYIYEKFPEMPEGELSKLRASVVCEGSLAKKAKELDFGKYLLLGKGEELTGGRERVSILADAFEAVIGAICMDSGIDIAKKYVLGIMSDTVEELKSSFRDADFKTKLQEIIQKNSKEPLVYKIVDENGPDHGKEFTAQVSHEGRAMGTGRGRSKKEAEQSAAKAALDKIGMGKRR
ncbi:MAG: ribonuclease III [Firmicutes bacterium]|nr:ribonuclease III [Bacillota bacterium]